LSQQESSCRKVHLRRLTGDDVDKTFAWRNDPSIYKWCRQNDVLHYNNHANWFNSLGKDPSISMYAIEANDMENETPVGNVLGLSHDTLMVGVCGLTSIDLINRRAEFSMYIGPEYQGKGYGEAALRQLIRKGFHTYGLNCIWGETFDGNPALNLFKKVGFSHDGTHRQTYFRDGKFIDSHIVSILRSEYDSSNFKLSA
jgi:RimJ/RimL family protein N-acetyltransferase